jgi:hypothetical protein
MQPTMTTSVSGTIRYQLNDLFHREDGPAIIWPDGTQWWMLNGKEYSFRDFCKKLKLSDEDIVFLKLKYNPYITA